MCFRSKPKLELNLITDYFRSMFTCNYDRLPPEVFHHPFVLHSSSAMSRYTNCKSHLPYFQAVPTEEVNTKHHAGHSELYKIPPPGIRRCVSYLSSYCGVSATMTAPPSKNRRNVTLSRENKCLEIIHAVQKLDNLHKPLPELIESIHAAIGAVPPGLDLRKFIDHAKCVQELADMSDPCIHIPKAMCNSRKIHAAEVLRLNMEDLEGIIQDFPDIHVIHYTRDPRGIVTSRQRVPLLMWAKVNAPVDTEAEIICNKMRGDIVAKEELAAKYPGVFIDAKYEDLVLSPVETAEGIFQHLGRAVSTSWKNWSEQSTNGSHIKSAFGTGPRNGSLVVGKWQYKLNAEVLEQINAVCEDIIIDLGYDL